MSRSTESHSKRASAGNGEIPLGRESRISVRLLNPEVDVEGVKSPVFNLDRDLRAAGLRSLGKENLAEMEAFYEGRATEILDRLLAIRTARKKSR